MFMKFNMDDVRMLMDPLLRMMLILIIPLASVFVLSRVIAPIVNTYRFTQFRRLPRLISRKQTIRTSARWAKHVIMLSRSISKEAEDRSEDELIQRFILQTMSIFTMTYFGYCMWQGLINGSIINGVNWFDRWAITCAVMASLLPYFMMRLRLYRIRVKNSYDLVPAVHLLLTKYTEFHGNLYYATFETTKELEGDILSAFVGLLPALQGSANASIEEALELFIFRIETTWAIQLGILMHKSESQGDHIEQGLRWLIADMSEVAKITEEIKSENRETIQMAYMPAFLLPTVIYLNQYPSMGKSWHYYFQTNAGMRMIMFTLLFTVICGLVAYMIQKPRNEV